MYYPANPNHKVWYICGINVLSRVSHGSNPSCIIIRILGSSSWQGNDTGMPGQMIHHRRGLPSSSSQGGGFPTPIKYGPFTITRLRFLFSTEIFNILLVKYKNEYYKCRTAWTKDNRIFKSPKWHLSPDCASCQVIFFVVLLLPVFICFLAPYFSA